MSTVEKGSEMLLLISQLISQNNQLIQNQNTLIEQNSQLIQVNLEQAAQINEMLDHLDLGDQRSERDLDDED
ncbi:hypothetical protein [Acinetobacter chinensis]|jgi:predicted PurR-regulated permease PerM|uniref:hypothetical protein n=1 Tax=Acinetobacter chinensis TaxID=2004650 RepID=UPI002934627D|nr:hypothetical protein [Acinetobacter chinensis]WOE43074.1 hypothetical protein QSG87_08150 [Acinetobacter chinensis]